MDYCNLEADFEITIIARKAEFTSRVMLKTGAKTELTTPPALAYD